MFVDLADRFHVGDGCAGGFIGELEEVHDGGEKMIGMGGFEVLNDSVEHGDAIGFV